MSLLNSSQCIAHLIAQCFISIFSYCVCCCLMAYNCITVVGSVWPLTSLLLLWVKLWVGTCWTEANTETTVREKTCYGRFKFKSVCYSWCQIIQAETRICKWYLPIFGKCVRNSFHERSSFSKTNNLQNSIVGIFSNGFIKLVQKTDITHSKCHLFFVKLIFHTNPHRLRSFDARKKRKK